MIRYILFVLVILASVFVQSVAGFGGTLLGMPLGIMLLGMETTKPVMTFVAWITGLLVLAARLRSINLKEFLKMTLVMMAGVLAGLWVSGAASLSLLLVLYGIIVAGIGIQRLFFPSKKSAPVPVQNTALCLAGIMQGLFVSGGSFLVVYASERIKEKQEFRATVNAVWGVLNIVMIISYFRSGAVTKDVLTLSGILILPVIASVWAGGLLASRVRQETFLKIVYWVLVFSGVVLTVTNL